MPPSTSTRSACTTAGAPAAGDIVTPRRRTREPVTTAESTLTATPSRVLRTCPTRRPVRRASLRTYQAAATPTTTIATRTTIAVRRTGRFMGSRYQTRIRPGRLADSVTAGQAQHVLAQVVEHHLLGHRGDLVEADLAPQTLDVELLGVAVPTVRLYGHVTGLEAGVGSQQLGGVGLGPAGSPVIEQPGRL